MRILHLIETTGPGGAETIFVDIAAGLVRRGHSSLPVIHGPGWVADALRSAGLEPFIRPLGRSTDLVFLARLDALVRRERVDLIQTHLLGSSALGSVVGRFRGVPVVATLHGVNDLGAPSRGRSAKLAAIRWAATRTVFVSESLRRALTPIVRVPASRTAVVHNGIDCDRFTAGRDGAFRRELGVTDEQFLVGAVGNVRPAKDYATLLRAAAVLAGRSPRWRFVVVGDRAEGSALFAELQALQQSLGLADRVTFAGFRPDVERVMNGVDVLLCSSTAEGFSLTTCQAMASGVPVVSTRCGGPEEILADGATGLLVDVGAPGQIADAVERVATDAGLRERLVRAAREDVVSRFSLESMLTAYEKLYAGLVPARRARSRAGSDL